MEDLTLFYSLFVQDMHHMVFKTTLENVYTTCIIYTYDAYKKECCKKAGTFPNVKRTCKYPYRLKVDDCMNIYIAGMFLK